MAMPSEQELEEFLASALEAAASAGIILRQYWGKLLTIEEKSHPGDLVTIADRTAEERIIELLHERYPHHAILAEESGARFVSADKDGSEFTWAIDPLDGTTNYTHQFPMVCISIALLYGDRPIVCVVYNPIIGELFHATKGGGAFLDAMPMKVSTVSEIGKSLLATGFAYDRTVNVNNNLAEFSKLTLYSQGVRRMGSAALDLAYVAAGRLDGYWETNLQPWDVAAGILLVTEAGGQVTDYDTSPFKLYSGRILATNKALHQPLSAALKI
ncbi:MAG: inositol monophosphatase [Parachlamydiaceae bacterium]|nr:inositol monophosphatase [Parachlamydiaceae bacterium]